MSFDFSKIDNWDDFLKQTVGDNERNQIEVIELVTRHNHLNNVDYNRSIALVDEGELYVHITHDLDQSFIQTYAAGERKTEELLAQASRLIANKMRDCVERLRVMDRL